jgi:transcriptional regulator GlxA family with amidase domain
MSANERIAVLAFDGISPFHLSVPCLVFGEDRRDLGVPRWPVAVCAEERGPLRSSAGFTLQATHGLRSLEAAGLVIVPSWRDPAERPPELVLRALRRAHERGARVVGLCLGAFVLAEAGLLEGRLATTHWAWADEFARRFPQVRLNPEVLYVDDGDIVTSAGTAASLDCCLHLLRQRVGADVANRVARRLVVAPHRAGGQAQFVEAPLPDSRRVGRLAALLDWIEAHLDQPIDVDVLAAQAALSRRHFSRCFREATGTTVWQWVLQRRVARACHWLEASDRGIEAVAAEAGFASAVALRKAFVASLGQSPSSYRSAFRRQAGATGQVLKPADRVPIKPAR